MQITAITPVMRKIRARIDLKRKRDI